MDDVTGLTFSEDDLRTLAGSRSFGRARDYLEAVDELDIAAGRVTAVVYGGTEYGVELGIDPAGGLSGECSCPYGQDGNFCKHCVAVGLVVLSQDAEHLISAAGTARGGGLDAWLEGLSREELLDLLREQLSRDRDLRCRLEARAAAARAGGVDLTEVRAKIARLLDVRRHAQYGYVEYHDASAFAAQAAEVVTTIRSMTAAGRSAMAVPLARDAITMLGDVYEQVDDSSGVIGEVAAGIEEAHREACEVAGADPLETATWLAGHLLGPRSSVPDIEVEDYRDVLGEPGRARLRDLVVEAWRRNPSGWAEKYVMEQITRDEGDLDALVALLASDLAPHGGTHLTIAGELDAAGRDADALAWAERGLRDSAGSAWVDDRLVDWVAGRYERSGRFSDAVAVRRDRLRGSPTLGAYQKLRATARDAGCWESERAAALERLDAAPPTPVDALVEALIDDGDLDAAWRAAPGRAGEQQWLALADLVRGERPGDALEVYRRAVEALTGVTGDRSYREMASLLLRARGCHEQLGTGAEFTAYLTALRADQRRKRNLMRILDQHGL